ncbi:MAG TPA: CHASE3 domain-containing protein [Pseudolabrys sp.]
MSDAPRSSFPFQPILLGIGFLLLIAISVATTWLVNQSADDAAAVAHTLRVQDKLSNLLLDVRRAESGQRGYLLTNDQQYLEDYREVVPTFDGQIGELRTLTQDNPSRTFAFDEAAALIKTKISEMDRTIDINSSGDRQEALKLVLGGLGRDTMNRLRELVERLIADEGRLLDIRGERSRSNNFLLLMMALLGSAVVVLIGAASVFLVQRNYKRAEIARQTVEATNANLEQIVAYRTADLTEANEEIQRFAYIVSHDLRSPLVNIMGFTGELEALRQDIFEQVSKLQADLKGLNAQMEPGTAENVDRLGHDFDEAIRFIKTSIANMDRLINAVLKLSREGRRQFNPETIDMNGLLDTVTQTVAHRATEAGATITIDTLPPVESDRLALQQVFANLVDNALKYSRNDEPNRIAIIGQTHAGKAIYDVTDTGRGIDPHDHQRVFELFRRSGTQDKPGEGIGLAHVRALVRRLGGTLSLQSELGKGSTFTVTLPRRWTVEKRSAA